MMREKYKSWTSFGQVVWKPKVSTSLDDHRHAGSDGKWRLAARVPANCAEPSALFVGFSESKIPSPKQNPAKFLLRKILLLWTTHFDTLSLSSYTPT
jgi:hypothetical protein